MTASSQHAASFEFVRAMGPVARELLGEPSQETKDELRFGSRGSLSVSLVKGTWFDNEANAGGGVIDLVMSRQRVDKPAALAWLREHKHLEAAPASNNALNIVAVYDYTDENGSTLYQVCRIEPKDFRQRRPDPGKPGRYLWKMGSTRRVVYRLPEVMEAVRQGINVFICEGEKSVDALRALDVTATCSPGGANKWRPEYAATFKGADVLILPDNDAPGRQHAEMVANSLQGIASQVRVLELPNLPEKGDVADWIAGGGTAKQLEELASQASEEDEVKVSNIHLDHVQEEPPEPDPSDPGYEQELGGAAQFVDKTKFRRRDTPRAKPRCPERETDARPTASDDDRPVIRVSAGQLDRLATRAEAVLKASALPVYQRGSSMVRPTTFEVPASHGRMTVSAGLNIMTQAAMIDVYSQIARWERLDKRSNTWFPIDPPDKVAAIHLSRLGLWSVPAVAGVVTTPTLRPDCSVLLEAGYDRATRLYHVVDETLDLGEIKKKPTRADAEKALNLLKELLAEFPFVSEVDRAVALSMLITAVARGAMNVSPLHAIKASTAGTGKSYLADIASAITSGRPCPVISAAPEAAETEKRLVGLLLAAFPIISLDNVNGELGGDLLCQAVERPLIRLRPLGESKIIEVESRSCIIATGNGLRLVGDMVRRSLLGNLDANMERPELRQFQADPVKMVEADRGKYVAACLTIVRAYVVAGRPNKATPLASFEAWSDKVRSALIWLGEKDPCESMERAREDDPELSQVNEVLTLWKAHLGSGPGFSVTTRDVAEEACRRLPTQIGEPTEWACPDFRDALLRIAGTRGNIDTRALGKWLLDHEGRIASGMKITREGNAKGGVVKWVIVEVKEARRVG